MVKKAPSVGKELFIKQLMLLFGFGFGDEHRLALGHDVVELNRVAVRRAEDGDGASCDRFDKFVPAREHREASVGIGEFEEHEGVLALAVARLGLALFDAQIALAARVLGGTDDELIGPVGLFLGPVGHFGPAQLVRRGKRARDEVQRKFDFQILLPGLRLVRSERGHGLGERQHQEEELERDGVEDVLEERGDYAQHLRGRTSFEHSEQTFDGFEVHLHHFESVVFAAVLHFDIARILALEHLEALVMGGFVRHILGEEHHIARDGICVVCGAEFHHGVDFLEFFHLRRILFEGDAQGREGGGEVYLGSQDVFIACFHTYLLLVLVGPVVFFDLFAHYLHDGFHYALAGELVLGIKVLGFADGAELVGDANLGQDAALAALREDGRDRVAETADDVVFLHRDDTACLDCRFDDGFLVDGLERVHVDDLRADALLFEHIARDVRVTRGHAARDDGDVASVLELHRLADLEVLAPLVVLTLVQERLHAAADAEIEGTGDVDALLDGDCRFVCVGGDDDGHVRDSAHDGEVLDAMGGGGCRAEGHAAVGGDDLDGQFLIGAVSPDLLAASQAREDGEGGREGDESDFRKTCRDSEEVLFCDTDVEESVGEGFSEEAYIRGFCQVGGHADDTGIFRGEFGERSAVHCAGRHFVAVIDVPCSSHSVPP